MTGKSVLPVFAVTVAAVLAAGLGLVGLASLALRRRQPALVRELWLRYASWVGMAAIVLGTLALGRPAWITLVALLSLAAFREYARAVGLWVDRGFRITSVGCIGVVYLSAWLSPAWPVGDAPPGSDRYGLAMTLPVYATLLLFVVPIARDAFGQILARMGQAVLGVLCFGWLLGHLAYLANLPNGVGLVLFLAFLVALHDVAAFTTGRLIGRHKLRPSLSPGKTWEGAVGALVATAAAGWGLRWLVPGYSGPHLVAATLLVSTGATLGDLALSVLKRDLGLKDWGHTIPGHGGLLDRVNSLMFAAPLFFHYTRAFSG